MDTNLEKLRTMLGSDSSRSISPLMRWLNPTLMSIEKMGLIYRYLIRREMTNPFGRLHGGVTAAIIDDAIGASMLAFDQDHLCLTVSNNIEYTASAKEGETIFAVTSIVENRSRIATAHCEIFNKDRSVLIAKGISKMIKKAKQEQTESGSAG